MRRAFPGTPWVFLYRDPVEIAVSQLAEPAARLIPGMLGPASLLVPPEASTRMSREEFVARVIGGILALGVKHCEQAGGLPVNYAELPGAVWARLAKALGVTDEPATLSGLCAVLSQDAKRPGHGFDADSSQKQSRASQALRAAIEAHAMPHYRKLEAMRLRCA